MARRKTIRPIDLDKTVQEICAKYGDSVYDVMGDAVKEVSDEATQKLRAVNFKTGGEYSADWIAEEIPKGRLNKTAIVRNEEHYRLAHLLEFGHVSKNGTGRTFGRVKAYPHIKPVEEWAKKALPQKVESMVKSI